MTRDELILFISDNKQLKDYCCYLCNGRDIHNDLYQEFVLRIVEMPEKQLIDKYKSYNFIALCHKIILDLNRNRLRGYRINGSENPLTERCNNNIFNFDDITTEYEYNYNIDELFDKTMSFLETNKKVHKYQCLILFNSIEATTKDIAQRIGAKERQVIYQNNKLKQLIKQHVK